MRDDPEVIALVLAARDGDAAAWDRLVERYAPLVWSTGRTYRLSPADIEDVGQTVWLRMVEQLPRLRVPAALPGWILTTTRRECLRVLRVADRVEPGEHVDTIPGPDLAGEDIDERIIAYERNAAIRAAFAELTPRCQHLLSLLMQDPAVSYGVISVRLGMRQGSVGPTRARCLERLRHCPALAALIAAEAGTHGGGDPHDE